MIKNAIIAFLATLNIGTFIVYRIAKKRSESHIKELEKLEDQLESEIQVTKFLQAEAKNRLDAADSLYQEAEERLREIQQIQNKEI